MWQENQDCFTGKNYIISQPAHPSFFAVRLSALQGLCASKTPNYNQLK